MNIKYTIDFHTYWHCGSGLAKGADVDALVIKDKKGLPYIPGKTIKGLIREAVDDIINYAGEKYQNEDYLKLFGYTDSDTNEEKKDVEGKISEAFFGNATLTEAEDILDNGLQRYLFDSLSNTAIGKDGTARKHSLRKMEVVVPCQLEGEILDVPTSMKPLLIDALRYIKCMGSSRNRGLGRCTIKEKEGKK